MVALRDLRPGAARRGEAGQEQGMGTNGAWWRYAIQDRAWLGEARQGKARAWRGHQRCNGGGSAICG